MQRKDSSLELTEHCCTREPSGRVALSKALRLDGRKHILLVERRRRRWVLPSVQDGLLGLRRPCRRMGGRTCRGPAGFIESEFSALATATDSARWIVISFSSLNGGGIVNDLVTIFESPDVALFTMAKAALDEAGIRYVAQNELTQDLFGLGRVGGGYNIVTGPPRIRVLSEDAERASEVLAELSG